MGKIWGWEQEDLEKTPSVTLLLLLEKQFLPDHRLAIVLHFILFPLLRHRFYKWNCSTKQTDTFKLPYTLTAYNKLFS